jgi:isoprenylcysteine carboxyl methyltransferase (ICMT) family protein YpbQ
MDFSLLTLLHVAVLLAVSVVFAAHQWQCAGLAAAGDLVPVVGVVMYLLIGERRLGRTWMRRAIAINPRCSETRAFRPPACGA